MTGTPEGAGRWPFAMRAALTLFFVLGVAASIRAMVHPDRHTVFPVFAGAALHWWADLPLYEDIYLDRTGGFRCSPTFAVAMTPFAWLGWTAGGIAWVWVSLAIYLGGLRRLVRDVLPGDWPIDREAAFLALGALGTVRSIWNGQANTLVIAMLLLAASAVMRRRWWAAAFLLAGPVFLKLSPLAVAMLFCALWPRQLGIRFLVALLVGSLVPFLTRPPETVIAQYQGWLTHLAQSSSWRWPGLRDGWTVYLLISNSLTGSARDLSLTSIDAPLYRFMQLTTAAATLGWCLWLRWRGASPRLRVVGTLGMGVSWLMVFGPATEFPTYVLIAPLIGWAVLEAGEHRRGRAVAVTAFVLTALLPWSAITRLVEPSFPAIAGVLPVGSACFALWLMFAVSWLDGPREIEPLPSIRELRIIKQQVLQGQRT